MQEPNSIDQRYEAFRKNLPSKEVWEAGTAYSRSTIITSNLVVDQVYYQSKALIVSFRRACEAKNCQDGMNNYVYRSHETLLEIVDLMKRYIKTWIME